MYLTPVPVGQKKKKKKKKAAPTKLPTAAPTKPAKKPEPYSKVDFTKKNKNRQQKQQHNDHKKGKAAPMATKKSGGAGFVLDQAQLTVEDDYNVQGGDGYLQVEEGTMPKGQSMQEWEAETGVYDMQTTVDYKSAAGRP